MSTHPYCQLRFFVALLALVAFVSVGRARAGVVDDAGSRVAVAWTELGTGAGFVRAMNADAPWDYVSDALEVGRDPLLRFAQDKLYVVSPTDGTIQVVSPATWSIERTYSLGAGSMPVDVAVVSPDTAFVTRQNATELLRLDLTTGISQPSVDLAAFADEDGVPDLNTMIEHEGRLFVQVRRLNLDAPNGAVPPGYLAVVDIASETLIDVDPVQPGTQAIELAGMYPKLKMQVVPETRRLFVSATGDFFDDGGIETIDLDTLRSQGLVIREADGLTGADLRPFVMVNAEEGFLAYSTDFTISSHLHRFSLRGGVEGDQLDAAVDYLAPTIAFDPATNHLFFPFGGQVETGMHVFDVATGERLTRELIPTTGPPTDLVVFTAIPEPSAGVLCCVLAVVAMSVQYRRNGTMTFSRNGR